jgi:hypothetical protein
LCEVLHRQRFRFRKACFAQSGNARLQNFSRRGADAVRAQGLNARKDFCRGFAGNTLVDDCFEKRFVDAVALVELELEFACAGDDIGEVRVVFCQELMRRDVVEGERQPLGRDFHYHCRVSIAKFLPSSKSLAAMSKSSSGEECHTGVNGVEVTRHLFECNLNLTGHAWDRMLCSASFEPKKGWRGHATS